MSVIKDRARKQGIKDSEDVILKELANRKKYHYIIPYSSNLKIVWDTLIIVLALIVTIMNSICISFDPPFRRTPGYPGLNLFVDAMFALDMVLIFRTSRLNFNTGEEINDPRNLAVTYIKSYRFWVDLLSIIPFEMFDDKDLLILFSMLKIFRIGRIKKII